MSNQEIINQIKEHILKEASSWSNWYVGITNDANRRLFEEHKVDKDNGWWIYRNASSDGDARLIEKYFINIGCQGGTGGGDSSSTIVYAYKITNSTVE